MHFTEDDLTFFVKNIWTDDLSSNDGGWVHQIYFPFGLY